MKFKSIKTERTVIRIPTVKDAKLMHEGLKSSIRQLKPWMPWAQELASLDDTKYFLKQAEGIWAKSEESLVERSLIILDASGKKFVGSTGIKPHNLFVPSFEVGYWVNVEFAGQGLITEAINGLCRYLFMERRANRIEVHCEAENLRSCLVAERLNFTMEGQLKNHRLTADSLRLADTKLYAMTCVDDLPEQPTTWQV